MINHIKENVIVYVSTTIIASLFIFFGISFMELRSDVKNIQRISQQNTILIQEMRKDYSDLSKEFNSIEKNTEDLIKLKTSFNNLNDIMTNWFFK